MYKKHSWSETRIAEGEDELLMFSKLNINFLNGPFIINSIQI